MILEMGFKDRRDAGKKLLEKLRSDKNLRIKPDTCVVVSLLRGGIIPGNELAAGLKTGHIPLAVVKIPAPGNPELALGAICFSAVYLELQIVNSLTLKPPVVLTQIKSAASKFNSYLDRFGLEEKLYRSLSGKTIILTDDGVATGSTVKASAMYLKSLKPKSVILAVPAAPPGFSASGIDKQIILEQNPSFSAVSQYYESFSGIDDREVKRIIKFRTPTR